ncbi:MAG: hypothetical protein ACR2HE_00270 [Casimicrobiaceae bacterium]
MYGINGPSGAMDKRCRIRVMMNGLSAVVIEDTEADLYLAIDRAAACAAWRVTTRTATRSRWTSRHW